MSSLARERLMAERKAWRKDHPYGFVAKPETKDDGSVDLLKWKCTIPGEKGTDWEGSNYPVTLEFTDDYPTKPPIARLPALFYHPNIFPSGRVCLSILNEEKGWKPSITVTQILTGIQRLLKEPNLGDPAQEPALYDLRDNPEKYHKLVREQAKKYIAADP